MKRHTSIGLLICLIFLTSCGPSNFALDLKLILASSGPLVESLNLGDKKTAVIQDFTDLANAAAVMADDFKAAGTDKSLKLAAVERFEVRFFDVERHGH